MTRCHRNVPEDLFHCSSGSSRVQDPCWLQLQTPGNSGEDDNKLLDHLKATLSPYLYDCKSQRDRLISCHHPSKLTTLYQHITMSTQTILPEVSQTERHGYLFGAPISHSMSPLLHQTVYDGLGLNWAQYPLESRDMNLFLQLIKHPRFYGTYNRSRYEILSDLHLQRSLSNNAAQSRNPKAS